MLDAVLGAAVALFFGGGVYALLSRPLSVPADPTDVRNAGWDGKQFTKVETKAIDVKGSDEIANAVEYQFASWFGFAIQVVPASAVVGQSAYFIRREV